MTPKPLPQIYEELCQKIEEAVPGIVVAGHSGCSHKACWRCGTDAEGMACTREITLEDVLITLDKSEWGCDMAVSTAGMFVELNTCGNYFEECGDSDGRIVLWHPNRPLSQQSEATQRFIHSVLFPSSTL